MLMIVPSSKNLNPCQRSTCLATTGAFREASKGNIYQESVSCIIKTGSKKSTHFTKY